MNKCELCKAGPTEVNKSHYTQDKYICLSCFFRLQKKGEKIENKTTCWHCHAEFVYPDPQYRDVDCPQCKVMNTIIDEKNILTET